MINEKLLEMAKEFKEMNCTINPWLAVSKEKWDSSWAEQFYKDLVSLANDSTVKK